MSFLPSRHTMRGNLVWGVVLLLLVCGGFYWFWKHQPSRDIILSDEEAMIIDSLSIAIAADSAAYMEQWLEAHPQYKRHGWRNYSDRRNYTPRKVETFPFDPNHCDSLTFLRLGLRPWQAHNALQYRRKGGVWRSAEQFSKLYGLSDSDYQRLAPYIRIDSAARRPVATASANNQAPPPRNYPEKYTLGSHTFDINECDTGDLQHIPEIGSYRARQIVQYRQRLGGFVSTSQLQEIQGLPTGIEAWFTIDRHAVPEKINLNTATYQQMIRHPYFTPEITREILNYRKRFGKLNSWDDLRLSPHITTNDITRLQPYTEF